MRVGRNLVPCHFVSVRRPSEADSQYKLREMRLYYRAATGAKSRRCGIKRVKIKKNSKGSWSSKLYICEDGGEGGGGGNDAEMRKASIRNSKGNN